MAFAETVRQPSLNSQQSTTTTTTTTTQSDDQHSHHPHQLFANAFNVTRSSDSSLSSMSSSTSSTTNRINSFHRRRLNSHHNHMMYRTGSGNRNGRTTTRLTTSTTTPPVMMDEETAYRIMMQQREEAFARARREAHADLEAEHELMERRAVVQQQFQQQAQQQARTAVHHHHHQQQSQHQTNPSNSNGIRTNPSANGSNGQAQHRVYLINCRSCGSFLTDRGMKAVLLLRPHITLYSTDAMPNCGPLHQPSRLAEPSLPNEPIVERTCDCLTQTLGCFGCGNAVGYHIVSPCLRCTNSVAKHQRSSNGHRTVLHCAEISVRERRYVPGEPGVLVAPYQPPPLPMPRSMISSRYQSSLRRMADEQEEDLDEEDEEMDEEEDEEDEEELDEEEEDEFAEANDKSYREESMNGMRNGLIFPISPYRIIKRGDVLFWSDLAPGGERSIPIDSDDYLDQPLAGR